ncbi:MAG: class I SAM-dependent methyltransferase [Anaerolineae bacterium]|nr:class I SAM-dependent methyltransferase [Anaerolineae bacterium]
MNAQGTMHDNYRELLARHGRLHWWLAGMRQIVWALLNNPQGRLLDIGCGPGWLIAEAPRGVWATGVDLELQFARVRPVVKGDAHRLPFPDRAFTIVTALDVLEQAGIDPRTVLAEARRVLVPGGRLLVRVPAHPALYGPHDAFWGGARRYRRAELEGLIRRAGFIIHRLTYANSLLFPVGAAARLAARFGRLSGNDLYPAPEPFNRLLTGVLALEARWLRTHDFPLGLSLLCLAEPG